MKGSLPFVLIALVLVGGVLAYLLLKGKTQQASVTAGVPTIGGGISTDFVDEVAGDLGYTV